MIGGGPRYFDFLAVFRFAVFFLAVFFLAVFFLAVFFLKNLVVNKKAS